MLSFYCIKGIEYFFRIKRKFPSDEFDFSSEGNCDFFRREKGFIRLDIPG